MQAELVLGIRRQFFRKRLRKKILIKELASLNMCPLSDEDFDNWKTTKKFPTQELASWFASNPYELRHKAVMEKLSVVVWLKIRKNDIIPKCLWWNNMVVVWLKIRKNDITAEERISRIEVVVWLKIRKNDIKIHFHNMMPQVVVWLKIRKNDIFGMVKAFYCCVVVWLKIRKNDIPFGIDCYLGIGCGLIKD